jgi:hypothetical protein
MPNRQDFLRFAEQCSRMVEDDDVADRRETLENMARAWRQLAAEEERIDDLVQAVDQLFATPVRSSENRRWPFVQLAS